MNRALIDPRGQQNTRLLKSITKVATVNAHIL